MPFLEYADQNRIILVVLSPHSTHRLQPLDVRLFGLLSTYYSQVIDTILSKSQGLIRLTKRDFWPMFKEAWEKAFCTENIESAQEAVGIHPFNPERVISTVVRRQTPPVEESEPSQKFKTPGSSRSLRYTFRRLQNEGKVHPNAIVLLYANEKLAANLDM